MRLNNYSGEWSLAPAYDMTFSYNPNSYWTSMHQMQINGKREGLTIEDLVACGENMDISSKKIKRIIGQVIAVDECKSKNERAYVKVNAATS